MTARNFTVYLKNQKDKILKLRIIIVAINITVNRPKVRYFVQTVNEGAWQNIYMSLRVQNKREIRYSFEFIIYDFELLRSRAKCFQNILYIHTYSNSR